MRRSLHLVLTSFLTAPFTATAGPPFVTDDPEPVEIGHFELNIAAQFARGSGDNTLGLPRAELNYGPCKDVQIGIMVPLEFDNPNGSGSEAGLGDIELSLKYRFLQETESTPMAAFFPSVSLPTGDKSRGLGAGEPAFFLPIWFQKSWDQEKWTACGGGGWTINPAGDNFMRSALLLKRKLTEKLTLGSELFFETADAADANDHLGFNFGGTFGLNEHSSLLFAAGRDIVGPNQISTFLGIQLSW